MDNSSGMLKTTCRGIKWEGEAPAEPLLSSAGASLSHEISWQVVFGLLLALSVVLRCDGYRKNIVFGPIAGLSYFTKFSSRHDPDGIANGKKLR